MTPHTHKGCSSSQNSFIPIPSFWLSKAPEKWAEHADFLFHKETKIQRVWETSVPRTRKRGSDSQHQPSWPLGWPSMPPHCLLSLQGPDLPAPLPAETLSDTNRDTDGTDHKRIYGFHQELEAEHQRELNIMDTVILEPSIYRRRNTLQGSSHVLLLDPPKSGHNSWALMSKYAIVFAGSVVYQFALRESWVLIMDP